MRLNNLFSALLLSFAFAATSALATFEENTHYETISTLPATTGATVTEFFSFNCPHCYTLEPTIRHFQETKSDQTQLNRVHVTFQRDEWELSQDAFILMSLLNLEEKLGNKVFERIHREKRPFKSREDVIDFFAANGVEREKAQKVLDSFAATASRKRQDNMTQKARITGVPTVIVNNKYKVNVGSVKSKEEFAELINYLLGRN